MRLIQAYSSIDAHQGPQQISLNYEANLNERTDHVKQKSGPCRAMARTQASKTDWQQFQTKWELGHRDMSWPEQNDCGVLPLIPQSVQTELS